MGRLKELDGLRGLAAAVVVVTHAAYFAHAPGWLFVTPLGLALSGFEAVIVFFTLSGFVLALPYAAGSPPEYRTFLVRRFLRLWPAAAVAIVVAVLLRGAGVEVGVLLAVLSTGLFVSGSHVLTALSTPLWSLVQEIRASIAFPLLVRISRSRVGCAAVAFGWVAGCVLIGRLGSEAGVSLLVAPAFIVGIRLAHTRWLPATSGTRLAGVALVLVALTHVAGRGAWGWAWRHGLTIPVDVAAAVLLIAAAQRSPRHLLSEPAQYLGRVSYSLYLLHFPILYAFSQAGRAMIPLGVVVSVAAADISQRLVEAPAMRLRPHHEMTITRPLPPLPPVPPEVT